MKCSYCGKEMGRIYYCNVESNHGDGICRFCRDHIFHHPIIPFPHLELSRLKEAEEMLSDRNSILDKENTKLKSIIKDMSSRKADRVGKIRKLGRTINDLQNTINGLRYGRIETFMNSHPEKTIIHTPRAVGRTNAMFESCIKDREEKVRELYKENKKKDDTIERYRESQCSSMRKILELEQEIVVLKETQWDSKCHTAALDEAGRRRNIICELRTEIYEMQKEKKSLKAVIAELVFVLERSKANMIFLSDDTLSEQIQYLIKDIDISLSGAKKILDGEIQGKSEMIINLRQFLPKSYDHSNVYVTRDKNGTYKLWNTVLADLHLKDGKWLCCCQRPDKCRLGWVKQKNWRVPIQIQPGHSRIVSID